MSFKVVGERFEYNANAMKQKVFVDLAESLAHDVLARITRNVQQGRKADGGVMKRYSPAYIEAIRAGQVKGKNGVRKAYRGRTNLTITGELLQSRQVKRIPKGAEIFFLGGHAGGISNQELAVQLQRKGFTGWNELGPKDEKMIDEQVTAEVERVVDELIK